MHYCSLKNPVILYLGQFVTQKIQQDGSGIELAFVWNRSKDVLHLKGIGNEYILENLEECASKTPDLIVEVAHPVVIEKVNTHCNIS